MVGFIVNRENGADLSHLIANAQSKRGDDSPAMNEIIRRFEGLTQRLSRSMTNSIDLRDDLANAARVGLVRAVRRHDQEQTGFPAYAEKYMRGAILREYQKWIVPETPSSEIIEGTDISHGVDNPHERLLDDLAPWGSGSSATAIDELTQSQRQIAVLRYVEDASLQSIATATRTTASAVSQRLSTIHRKVEQAAAA
jgi:RNA polymerase sigma factor (sigma-70 family)